MLGPQHNRHSRLHLPKRQVRILVFAEYVFGVGAGFDLDFEVCLLCFCLDTSLVR